MNARSTVRGAGSARMQGNFVLLRCDSLRLLLPGQDVGAAEYLDSAPRATGQAGMFAYGDGARPLVALSAQMGALDAFPIDRFLITPLVGGQRELSFAWNEVRVLIGIELERHALPTAMQGPGAVIDGYVELDGEIALCSTAQRVISYAVETRS